MVDISKETIKLSLASDGTEGWAFVHLPPWEHSHSRLREHVKPSLVTRISEYFVKECKGKKREFHATDGKMYTSKDACVVAYEKVIEQWVKEVAEGDPWNYNINSSLRKLGKNHALHETIKNMRVEIQAVQDKYLK